MKPFVSPVALAAVLTVGAACSRASAPSPAAARPSATAGQDSRVEAEIPSMSVAELAAALETPGSVFVYDANGPERYERGHIPTARHVGHDAVTAAMLPPDRGSRLVFYCYNEH